MIMRILPLLARPSRAGASTLLLPAIAFACVSALLAVVIGGAQSFWTYTDELAELYRSFAAMALVLLVIPLVSLAQAAARLSAKRRDDRLAALRLLGMSSGQTSMLAITEASIVAAAGAIAGVLVSYVLSPLIGLIHFRGEALGTGSVALPVWSALLLIIGVTVIAAASSWVSLRRVRISPLGVALKERAPRPAWVSALIAVVGIVIAMVVSAGMRQLVAEEGVFTAVMALVIAFGVALLAIDLIGAWILGLFGKRKAKRAKTSQDLIAARMILESPRAAWRQVSGLALTSFVAVVGGVGVAFGESTFSAPPPEAAQYMIPGEEFLNGDIRTGVLITVIASFIMVACAVGVGQAAQILDRREISRSLDIMGTPIDVQQKTRIRATMLPLLLSSVGSAIFASVLLLPVVGFAFVTGPVSMFISIGSIGLGILIVRFALTATSPLQASVAKGAPALAA